MKYYLVPVNKLRLAEGQADKTRSEEKKSWTRVEELFKSSPHKEAAAGVISMLKELTPVSLRNGIVLLNNDLKTAVGAHQLIKNLCDSSAALPAVERFLKRLRDLDPSTPKAKKIYIITLPLTNNVFSHSGSAIQTDQAQGQSEGKAQATPLYSIHQLRCKYYSANPDRNV